MATLWLNGKSIKIKWDSRESIINSILMKFVLNANDENHSHDGEVGAIYVENRKYIAKGK